MPNTNSDLLRDRARRYRERADSERHDSIITEAFYQMAKALEGRAAVCDAAGAPVLDRSKRARQK
jgi:hypothetical protein